MRRLLVVETGISDGSVRTEDGYVLFRFVTLPTQHAGRIMHWLFDEVYTPFPRQS
jgi:hypothetical protein